MAGGQEPLLSGAAWVLHGDSRLQRPWRPRPSSLPRWTRHLAGPAGPGAPRAAEVPHAPLGLHPAAALAVSRLSPPACPACLSCTERRTHGQRLCRPPRPPSRCSRPRLRDALSLWERKQTQGLGDQREPLTHRACLPRGVPWLLPSHPVPESPGQTSRTHLYVPARKSGNGLPAPGSPRPGSPLRPAPEAEALRVIFGESVGVMSPCRSFPVLTDARVHPRRSLWAQAGAGARELHPSVPLRPLHTLPPK